MFSTAVNTFFSVSGNILQYKEEYNLDKRERERCENFGLFFQAIPAAYIIKNLFPGLLGYTGFAVSFIGLQILENLNPPTQQAVLSLAKGKNYLSIALKVSNLLIASSAIYTAGLTAPLTLSINAANAFFHIAALLYDGIKVASGDPYNIEESVEA